MKKLLSVAKANLFILIWFLIHSCHANQDYLNVITYESCYKAYQKKDYAMALELIDLMQMNLQGTSDRTLIQQVADSYYLKGYVQKQLAQPDSAFYAFFNAIKFNKRLGNEKQVGHLVIEIGRLFFENRVFDKATEYYKQALTIADKEQNDELLFLSLSNLGLTKRRTRQEEEAIHYYNKAIRLGEKLDKKEGLMDLFLGKGMCFYQIDDWAEAREYFFRSLRISRALGNRDLQGRNLNNIGSTYLKQEQPEAAMVYLNNARTLNIQDDRHMARVYLNYGHYHKMRKEHVKAVEYYDMAMEYGANMACLDEANHAYESLVAYFEANQEMAAALIYAKKLNELNTYVSEQKSRLNKSEKNFSLMLVENVLTLQDRTESKTWTLIKLLVATTLACVCFVIAFIKFVPTDKRSDHNMKLDFYSRLNDELIEQKKLKDAILKNERGGVK